MLIKVTKSDGQNYSIDDRDGTSLLKILKDESDFEGTAVIRVFDGKNQIAYAKTGKKAEYL